MERRGWVAKEGGAGPGDDKSDAKEGTIAAAAGEVTAIKARRVRVLRREGWRC